MWLVNFFDTYGYMISTLALLATLGFLIKYTVETTKLRKETVRQTELSQRPFVMIFETEISGRIMYKNSGQGIALNIRIKPFEDSGYTITFEKENILGSNEASKHDINPVAKDNKTGKAFPPNMKIPFTPHELRNSDFTVVRIIEIYYENIERKCYQTRAQISREGIKFLDTKKV